MRHNKLMVTTLLLLLSAGAAQGQGLGATGAVTEPNEFGVVDYSMRIITATGIGAIPTNAPNVGMARANAIRAAKLDALRNLVEAVKAVRITSETTVMNNMVSSDVIRTQVEAMVRGARQVGDVKYLSDASVELSMTVPMSGIMDAVLPASAAVATPGEDQPPALFPGIAGAANRALAPAAGASVALAIAGQPITGLIIDTRGLGVKPSMSPRVLTSDGSVIYGPGNYPRDFAVTQGVVGYHKDIAAAKLDSRVAGNPLTIKGTATQGTLGTDVVVATADARQAAGYAGYAEALSNCRVMFILD